MLHKGGISTHYATAGADLPSQAEKQPSSAVQLPITATLYAEHLTLFGAIIHHMAANVNTPKRKITRPQVCHSERRAKPGVEESSHQIEDCSQSSAKILRLAALAQDDRLSALLYRDIAK